LSIKTKSILFHNLEWLQKYDIDEVIVATKYHHNQIELALNKYQIEILFSSDLKINTHKLSKCVGTAQTLKSLSHKLDGGDFLFLDGDNLYNFDIENYYNVHKNNGKIISILSHMTMEDGKYKNFIKYKNGSDKIEKIIVKPEYKLNKQLLATSGACYLNPMIFNVIGNKDMCLFDNVIPKQLDNISVILDNDSVQFINTKQQYMSMSKNMEFV